MARSKPLARPFSAGRLQRWLLVVLAAGLLWRTVRYAAHFPLWGDEAFVAVNFFLRDFEGLLLRLEHDMVAPLGFLWGELAIARLLGHGEAALRLLPWCAGIVAFLLFLPLARAALGRHAALLAAAVLAASYYPVRHAAEVKPYAFDLLCSVVLFSAAFRVFLRGPGRARSWFPLGLLALAAPWFSYTSVFVSGGAFLVLGTLAWRDRDCRIPWAAFPWALGAAASFGAAYLLVGVHQQWSPEVIRAGQWARHFPPLGRPWLLPLWLVQEHTGNMFAYPNGGRDFGCALTTLLVIAGAVSLWRRGKGAHVLLFLSPLPFMFVAAALLKYPYGGSVRTTLHLAPAICLLAGEGAVAALGRFLSPRRAAAGVRVLCAILVVTALAGAARDVIRPYKKRSDRDNRAFVEALDRESGSRDAWVVFGRFGPCAYAPDLYPWGGTAARLRYYLLLHRGERSLLWAPEPAHVPAPADGARTWLIAYRDNHLPFPEAAWRAYRTAVVARRGPPEARRIPFGAPPEGVEVLLFAPAP